MATINYNFAPIFVYKGQSYRENIADIPITAKAQEVIVLVECERTPQEVFALVGEIPITNKGLIIPKVFKKKMRLTNKNLSGFEIVNELLSLIGENKSCSIATMCNEWDELEFIATFQNNDWMITIVGCDSEPHLYVQVIESVTGDTYISNGRLCKEGGISGVPYKMLDGYTEKEFKEICDEWVTAFTKSIRSMG